MAFLLIFNHDKKHRKKAMTNYITPNANYDLNFCISKIELKC